MAVFFNKGFGFEICDKRINTTKMLGSYIYTFPYWVVEVIESSKITLH